MPLMSSPLPMPAEVMVAMCWYSGDGRRPVFGSALRRLERGRWRKPCSV
jgi:hypothetical protein